MIRWSWEALDLYLAKNVMCPNQSFEEWYDGRYGLVNSKANNLFQSIMSYTKLVVGFIGFFLSLVFPLALKITKYLSNPKLIEENIEGQKS